MRHRKKGRKLNRTSSHKKAMFYNMSKSLIKYERIKTTIQKAKELRKYIEPIITTSKTNSLNNKRKILKKFKDKAIIKKLFKDIGIRFLNRNGGYTRIYKYKYRNGDGATMAIIELVDKKIN